MAALKAKRVPDRKGSAETAGGEPWEQGCCETTAGWLQREGISGEEKENNAAGQIEVEPGIVLGNGGRLGLAGFGEHRFFHGAAVALAEWLRV
jgi:hypothetical protein